MITETFTVNDGEIGQRIDVLSAQKFPELSRSRWQKKGKFELDGVEKPAKTKVRSGDNWTISCAPETTCDDLKAWDHPLKVLAESDSWVVIEKPYGIAVHPSISDSSQKTVVNALVHMFGEKLSENFDEIEGREIPRPGLVHRLDKTTSGVMLIAKTNEAHRYFQDNWKEFEKTYHCVVQGQPPINGKVESGITRDPHRRQRMTAANNDKAKWSVTTFERLEVVDKKALMKVNIHTGRTHQIRVHLSSIGFPVIGDVLYGDPKAARVMLHASELKFMNPDKDGEMVSVTSELPLNLKV